MHATSQLTSLEKIRLN